MEKPIILASASPRRKELLGKITPQFTTFVPDVAEVYPKSLTPGEVPFFLATLKAQAVANHYPDAVVIGCDTIVVVDDEVLGKPTSADDAARMLRLLSGRAHQVITGVALVVDGQTHHFSSATTVTFSPLNEEEIDQYIASGDPFDKAGAYGIQGGAAKLICRIEGDFFGVMGLPLAPLYAFLATNHLLPKI